jgi:hypothetical protein
MEREAVVDEQQLGSGRAQQGRRVVLRVASETALEHGFLLGVAPELVRQLDDRPPVRNRARDVRPLPRIRALREQCAELVERLRVSEQDPVRVVVDEADPG